jgi:hypothetical protein
MCNGITCYYTCSGGLWDCNFATQPDTDGCECTGTGCCGAGCQTQHNSGLSSPTHYYDCSGTGNSHAQATAACTELGGTGCADSSKCCGIWCGSPDTLSVCGTVGGTAYCWQYTGQHSGKVQQASSAACGSSSDPSWN